MQTLDPGLLSFIRGLPKADLHHHLDSVPARLDESSVAGQVDLVEDSRRPADDGVNVATVMNPFPFEREA